MNSKNSDFFTNETLSKLVTDIGVAFWVWDIQNDDIYYNSGFFDLIGHSYQEDAMTFESWYEVVYVEDREFAHNELLAFSRGEVDSYGIEIRVAQENGDIIWVYDTGKVTKVDENGKALEISGVTQNINKRKMYEEQLRKDENKLKMAMKFAGFSVWEWDITSDEVIYDDDYAKSLGYCNEMCGNSTQNWSTIIHPNDIPSVKENINNYLTKKGTSYNHKLRIRKNDGEYLWVRDVGEVSKFDENGEPCQVIGGRINIDELERAKGQITDYQMGLEVQIEQRTKELQRRDTILIELNQISQKIMATPTGENFNDTIYSYLEDFSTLQDNSRLTVYRNRLIHGRTFCYLDNKPPIPYKTNFTIEYVREVFKDVSVNFLSEGTYTENQREEFYQILLYNSKNIDLYNINYKEDFPTIYKHVQENKSLSIDTKNFSPKEFIFTHLQGVKSVLMSPIMINNEFWGYLLIDDYKGNSFSQDDEKTLTLLGSVLAQAIHKNELDLIAKEAIEHNKLLLNATPLACNLWKNGVNIGSNDETVRLFGLDNQEQVNEKFHLFSPEFQPCGRNSSELVAEKFMEAGKYGRVRFEWLHCNLQGELIPCEVTLVRLDRSKGYLVAGYVRDLREFKALIKDIEEKQTALEIAHEEALLSSKAKSNFLANMSHEIRTPMNAISGMTDIILRETTDDDINEYALNIKRATESLLSIINDVLDISKIESGKLDIVEGEYKLTHVLNDVLAIATNRLELKSLMFVTNFQSDLPNLLIGDDVRVKQIMVNILNNAIKFTSEGSIKFEVFGNYSGGMLELKFAVTDTGMGISQEDIEKLFIEFERVNTTKNRSIEGTGLGLAISKRLCDMMNGSIEVESEVGKGTTFTISVLQHYDEYIPLAKVKEEKSILIFESRDFYLKSIEESCKGLGLNTVVYCSLQSEFNDALQEKMFDYIFTSAMYLVKVQEMLLKHNYNSKIVLLADSVDIKSRYDYTTIVMPVNSVKIANVLNGKISVQDDAKNITNFIAPAAKVLVVDDNLVNLKVAKGLMRPYQFNIETAENGEEAVNKIKASKYDLVFMDHMMPVMDGIDATITVRSLQDEYYQKLPIIALTANAIIGTKEMFINEGMNDFLAKPIKLSALNEILNKWLPKELQLNNSDSDEVGDEVVTVTEINVPSLDAKLGLQRVGGDFETYVDILDMYYKDGLKRIPNIRGLYDSKKITEFKIEVHALKSASASVGALDMSEKARLLEDASIKEDWTYINQHTLEFIDDFNILLENIREALKGLIKTVDNASKEMGDDEFFAITLKELVEALDSIDINMCDELLEKLCNFNWSDDKLENINLIKDYVDGYEYDEAIEIIEKII